MVPQELTPARGTPFSWTPTSFLSPESTPYALHLGDAGSREGHDHGHHVDRQLELQELGDAVIHVASPHHGLDDAGEVVVGEDDV